MPEELSPPRSFEQTRVQWVDTDAGGRIHFTAAFRWAEAAETALYRMLGVEELEAYPRRAVEAEYLAVLRYGDELEVELAPTRLGDTSITYDWEIRRDGQTCVRGRHTVVHVDREGRPDPLSDDVRHKLSGG